MFDFGEVADEAITVVRAAREDGVPQAPEPVKWPTEVPTIERYRGGALMAGGRVAGVFGWTAPRTDAPALVRIGVVPEDLRPRP